MPGFFLALLQSLPPNEAVAKSPACLATDGALKLRELRNARSQELEGTMNLQTRTGVALPPVTSPVVPPASLRERRGKATAHCRSTRGCAARRWSRRVHRSGCRGTPEHRQEARRGVTAEDPGALLSAPSGRRRGPSRRGTAGWRRNGRKKRLIYGNYPGHVPVGHLRQSAERGAVMYAESDFELAVR